MNEYATVLNALRLANPSSYDAAVKMEDERREMSVRRPKPRHSKKKRGYGCRRHADAINPNRKQSLNDSSLFPDAQEHKRTLG